MKHTLLFILLIACYNMAFSQYDSALRYRNATIPFYVAIDTLIQQAIMADPGVSGEASVANVLARWENYMGSRISQDVPLGADMTAPMGAALRSYMSYVSSSCATSANWTCTGPFNSYYGTTDVEHQGRINAIWMNPVSGTILAGADGGGLWRSYNDGNNWHIDLHIFKKRCQCNTQTIT